MDRRRARSTLAAGLASALLVSAGVVAVSAAPSDRGCNARKKACEQTVVAATTTTTPPPSDTQAPVTTISSPTEGTAVATELEVAGSSSDNTAVSRVEVRVDVGSWSAASGTSAWSAALDTTAWAAGSSHTIAARAVDGAGNVSAAATVTVQKAADAASPPPPSGDHSIAPATQGTWVSPEGATINVNTVGAFTIRDVYRLLLENSAAAGDLVRI
ncbi:MAG TPA: Ig-like domain-containing protein, partial [Nitriliruptorales bacterium]